MEALSTLPTTLQEIYARTLNTLKSSNCYREALFMLQFVLWARRPPQFSEMIDAIAVRLHESPGFKQENRLFELMDVITQCSSLLTPVSSRYGREVHLAHSSVKEYLTSQHLAKPFKKLFAEVYARSTIARTSMQYLLDVANLHQDLITSSGITVEDLITMSPSDVVLSGCSLGRVRISAHPRGMHTVITMCESIFPFLQAASCWAEHATVVETANDEILRLVVDLYGQEQLWRRFPQILGSGIIHDRDYPLYFEKVDYRPEPLTHACFWGLEIAAQRLLKCYAHLSVSRDCFDSALFAACCSGHHSIVKMLLDRGAAVDGCMTGSRWDSRTPLDVASANGHIDIVKTLLQHRAEIGFTIEVAMITAQREILELLVNRVDNIPFFLLQNALCEAPIEDQVVSLLCSKPIVVDGFPISRFTRQLSNLLKRNEIAYAKLSLEKGFPEPNGPFEFSYEWPEWREQEHPEITKLLLDSGWARSEIMVQYAKLSVPRDPFELDYDWPKLPERGHIELARMLLDRGWILSDDMVQCVKLSDEKESQRPEKRCRLE